MAKPWADVAGSDAFKALSPEDQEAARNQYFDQVVAPQVPADDVKTARAQFDQATAGTATQREAERVARLGERGPLAGATDLGFKSMTFGLGDQLVAGMQAAETGVENLGRRAIGAKVPFSAGESYDATLKARREAEEGFSKAHPVGAAAADIVGGLAAPGGKQMGEFIAAAPGALGRIGRSAAVGGAIGEVAGGADSDVKTPEEHLWNAMRSGAGGAAFGAAVPALGEVSKYALPRVKAALAEAWHQGVVAATGQATAPTAITPEQQQKAFQVAQQVVQKMIASTGKTLPDLMKDEAFLAGKPITSAETIGRPAMSQLMLLGRRQGLTPDMLEAQLRQRLTETPERILNGLAQQSGVEPHLVQGNFDTAVQQIRARNKPLYDIAFDKPLPPSPELDALLKTDAVKKALSGAKRIASNEREDPNALGLVSHPITLISNKTGLPTTYEGEIEVKNPTMKTWDYIKRALGDDVYGRRDQFGRPLLDDEGRSVRKVLDDVRDELFWLNPAYQKAVAAGGEPIRLQEAFDTAPKLMRGTVSEADFNKIIAKDTAAELAARKGGWINSVYNQAQAGKLRLNDMTSPTFVAKTKALLGDQQGEAFIKDVLLEQRLTRNAQRMTPGTNSVTFDLQAADHEIDAALANVTRAAKAAGEGRFLSAAGHLLSSPATGARTPFNEAERNELGKLLAIPPDQLKRTLDAAAAHMNVGASPADELINKILGRVAVTGADVASQ